MRPDWKDAPAWANYLAVDIDGCWFWYEHEPTFLPRGGVWSPGDSRHALAGAPPIASESLEKRPASA